MLKNISKWIDSQRIKTGGLLVPTLTPCAPFGDELNEFASNTNRALTPWRTKPYQRWFLFVALRQKQSNRRLFITQEFHVSHTFNDYISVLPIRTLRPTLLSNIATLIDPYAAASEEKTFAVIKSNLLNKSFSFIDYTTPRLELDGHMYRGGPHELSASNYAKDYKVSFAGKINKEVVLLGQGGYITNGYALLQPQILFSAEVIMHETATRYEGEGFLIHEKFDVNFLNSNITRNCVTIEDSIIGIIYIYFNINSTPDFATVVGPFGRHHFVATQISWKANQQFGTTQYEVVLKNDDQSEFYRKNLTEIYRHSNTTTGLASNITVQMKQVAHAASERRVVLLEQSKTAYQPDTSKNCSVKYAVLLETV
jgi:hypothetical protein